MLLLLGIIFCAAGLAEAPEFPAPLNTLSDYTGMIDAPTKARVKALADEVRRITPVNFKAAIIYTSGSIEVAAYGEELFDEWGMGQSGVLLLISILDQDVKVVAGRDLGHILSPYVRDMIEWTMIASLAKGEFSKGLWLGSAVISKLILSEWRQARKRVYLLDWRAAILPFVFLTVASVLLTVIVGGNFIMAYATITAGLFGYLFLGSVGMALGAALGFFITWGGGRK